MIASPKIYKALYHLVFQWRYEDDPSPYVISTVLLDHAVDFALRVYDPEYVVSMVMDMVEEIEERLRERGCWPPQDLPWEPDS